MSKARQLIAGAVVAAALAVATSASAGSSHTDAIDPGTPVNGMLVVQGIAKEADVELFTPFCDPIVVKPGAVTRTCDPVPPWAKRIFIGYGLWGVTKKIVDTAWSKRSWRLWIDGRPVNLSSFGTTDRWIPSLPAADGRPALLREWAIVLVGAEGRHTIRYSPRRPRSVYSMTWKFTVSP
jgi:hypothetical protein